MSAVRDVIAGLVAGGMDPADAAALMVRASTELAVSAPSKAALRTRRWRAGQASQTVTGDDSVTLDETVTERHKPSPNVTGDDAPISTSKISKESKRQNRGTRISPDWALTDAERSFAKQEGFSDWEIQREAQKFRDYWTAAAGSKAVKRDWTATWRQWIRSGAERAGKTPAPSSPGGAAANAPGYYAKAESEQLAAWDAHSQRTTGKLLPRDRNFGWRVAAEWPPDHVPVESAPLLRVM
jgi:hypothetical protein